jgi:hypothetical protein
MFFPVFLFYFYFSGLGLVSTPNDLERNRQC